MMLLQPLDISTFVHNPKGWAMEVRINAEDPSRNFMPSSGTLGCVSWPQDPGKTLCSLGKLQYTGLRTL